MLYLFRCLKDLYRPRLRSELTFQCPLQILRSKPSTIHLRWSSTIRIGRAYWAFIVKLQNGNASNAAYFFLVPSSKNSIHIRNKVTWKPESPTGFLLIKPTDVLISQFYFLSRKSTCFGQFLCPSSGVFHCTFGTCICHQTCITYTSAECTVENSWWCAEELLETRRVSWQNEVGKLVRLLVLLKINLLRCTVTWT